MEAFYPTDCPASSTKCLPSWLQILRDNIKNYDIGMFEQNVITYLAMKQPQTAEKLYFENKFCINCW